MSSHNELLKEIEEHLEKLASAHTVLSDAIENEKRAGLVQAVTAGVGMATRGAQAVGGAVKEHFTQAKKGVGMMGEHFMDASPKGKLAVVGAAGAVGAASTYGARQEKQAESKLDAVKSILAKAKPSKGVQGAAAILASAQAGSMAANAVMNSGQNKQAAEDSEHTGYKPHYLRNMAIGAGVAAVPGLLRAKSLNGVIAKSKSNIEDLVKERRAVLDHTDSGLYAESAKFNANMAKVDDLKTRIKGEQGAIDSLNTKKRDTLKAAGGAGVIGSYVAAAGTAVHSDRKNRDELYQPRYGRNVAIATGLTSVLPGATLMELGLAAGGTALATKLNSMRHAYREKRASDQDQEQYSPHYVRNAILTGGALAAPDAARAYSSTAKGLDHRETFHEHSALSKRYLAEGDLINAAKYADSANKHKALAHEADLYTHNLGGSIGKKLATGAALATAVTGVNHIMRRGEEQTKSASLKAILQALETC